MDLTNINEGVITLIIFLIILIIIGIFTLFYYLHNKNTTPSISSTSPSLTQSETKK
jgi:flagellar basal body-associated protein FliL